MTFVTYCLIGKQNLRHTAIPDSLTTGLGCKNVHSFFGEFHSALTQEAISSSSMSFFFPQFLLKSWTQLQNCTQGSPNSFSIQLL